MSRAIPAGPTASSGPSWSPDGQWLAFSSDRNTDWRGHDGGKGWEHTQELSIYVDPCRRSGLSAVLPPSPAIASARRSGRPTAAHCFLRDDHGGHLGRTPAEPGRQGHLADRFRRRRDRRRVEHTSGPGPEGVSPNSSARPRSAICARADRTKGITTPRAGPALRPRMRAPTWSPDGKTVIYEKHGLQTPAPEQAALRLGSGLGVSPHRRIPGIVARRHSSPSREKQQGNSSHRDHESGRVATDGASSMPTAPTSTPRSSAWDGWRVPAELVARQSVGHVRSSACGFRRAAPARHGSCGCGGTAGPGSPHRWHGPFRLPELFRRRQRDRLSGLGRRRKGIRPAHPQS